MPPTIRTPADLDDLRRRHPDLVLLDVRLADDHAAAQASASSRVDLPEPFSPTKKVTGALNSSVSSA